MPSDSEILKERLLNLWKHLYPEEYYLIELDYPEIKDEQFKDKPWYISKANQLETLEKEIVENYVKSIWDFFSSGIYKFIKVDNSGEHNFDYEIIELHDCDLVPIYNLFIRKIDSFGKLNYLLSDLPQLSKKMKLDFKEVSPAIYLFYGHGLLVSLARILKQNKNLLFFTSMTNMISIFDRIKRLFQFTENSLLDILSYYKDPSNVAELDQLREDKPEIFKNSILGKLDLLSIEERLIKFIDEQDREILKLEDLYKNSKSNSLLNANDSTLINTFVDYLRVNGKIPQGKYFQKESFSYKNIFLDSDIIASAFDTLSINTKSEPKKLKFHVYANFYQKEMRFYVQELFPNKLNSEIDSIIQQAQDNYSLKKIIPDLIDELNKSAQISTH